MCTVIAYAGRYSYSFVMDIFASSGWLGGVLSTLLLIVLIYAMIKIDWTKFVEDMDD